MSNCASSDSNLGSHLIADSRNLLFQRVHQGTLDTLVGAVHRNGFRCRDLAPVIPKSSLWSHCIIVPGCGRSAPNASRQLPAYQKNASYAPAEGLKGNVSKFGADWRKKTYDTTGGS